MVWEAEIGYRLSAISFRLLRPNADSRQPKANKGFKRMKRLLALFIAGSLIGLCSTPARAEREALAEGAERVLFGFEKGTEGWEIPDWTSEKKVYVVKSIKASKDVSRSGKNSLKVQVNFTPRENAEAIVENFEYFDWAPYSEILCDIYVPKSGPHGLKAKIILTVGPKWKRVEMAHYVELSPGKWVTVSADLLAGSKDWAKPIVKEGFRKDVRKLAIKVESDHKAYSGPIYIDNVRLVVQ